MDNLATWVGYIVICSGAIIALSGIGVLVGLAITKATHSLLEAYGGTKTFLEFRDWYHNIRGK